MLISGEKLMGGATGVAAASRAPRFFDTWQYRTLCALCEAIIPGDDQCGGAIEAGVPEFIDLLTSENQRYQERILPGLKWFDVQCLARYGARYLECSLNQQNEILRQIAYHRNGSENDALTVGINCFSLLRKLTVGGFFTSATGIDYLRYIGNAHLAEFPGCPVPEGWPGSEAATTEKERR